MYIHIYLYFKYRLLNKICKNILPVLVSPVHSPFACLLLTEECWWWKGVPCSTFCPQEASTTAVLPLAQRPFSSALSATLKRATFTSEGFRPSHTPLLYLLRNQTSKGARAENWGRLHSCSWARVFRSLCLWSYLSSVVRLLCKNEKRNSTSKTSRPFITMYFFLCFLKSCLRRDATSSNRKKIVSTISLGVNEGSPMNNIYFQPFHLELTKVHRWTAYPLSGPFIFICVHMCFFEL